jgi:hypothetical protein
MLNYVPLAKTKTAACPSCIYTAATPLDGKKR